MLDHAIFIKPGTFAASDIVPGRVKMKFSKDFLSRSYEITSIDMIQMDSIFQEQLTSTPIK